VQIVAGIRRALEAAVKLLALLTVASCSSMPMHEPEGTIGSSAVTLDGMPLGSSAWMVAVDPDPEFQNYSLGWGIYFGDEDPGSACANASTENALASMNLIWMGNDLDASPRPIATGTYLVNHDGTPTSAQVVAQIFATTQGPLTSGNVILTTSTATLITGTVDAAGTTDHFAGTFSASLCTY
jgi:hypothetical protein